MTTSLQDLLEAHVSNGAVPGAVPLLARGEQVEVQAVGAAAVGGAAPMARDSIFRIAWITKPITAAAVEGQGWGFGGSVDDEAIEPWNVPGRYGWFGGTATTAHIVPSTGAVAILLTQVATADPVAPAIKRDFWRCAA